MVALEDIRQTLAGHRKNLLEHATRLKGRSTVWIIWFIKWKRTQKSNKEEYLMCKEADL